MTFKDVKIVNLFSIHTGVIDESHNRFLNYYQ